MGRNTILNDEISKYICDELAKGRSLKKICKDEKTPCGLDVPCSHTVLNWVLRPKNDREREFEKDYRKARQIQSEILSDELLEIADDGINDYMTNRYGERVVDNEAVNRSKLRVHTRQWILKQLQPKVYGDSITQKITDPDGKPLPIIKDIPKPTSEDDDKD